MINHYFNIARFSRLLMNDIRLHKKIILSVTLTLMLFVCHFADYFFVLYVGGFILSSMAFSEYHDPKRAHSALTLPCSALEKVLSKWMLTSIGYALGLVILYFLLSIVLHFGKSLERFDILQPALWMGIGKYILLQSVVFLGAISFKKYALIKTALTVSIFCAILFLIAINVSPLFLVSLSGISLYYFSWLAPVFWYVTYLKLTEYELR